MPHFPFAINLRQVVSRIAVWREGQMLTDLGPRTQCPGGEATCELWPGWTVGLMLLKEHGALFALALQAWSPDTFPNCVWRKGAFWGQLGKCCLIHFVKAPRSPAEEKFQPQLSHILTHWSFLNVPSSSSSLFCHWYPISNLQSLFFFLISPLANIYHQSSN